MRRVFEGDGMVTRIIYGLVFPFIFLWQIGFSQINDTQIESLLIDDDLPSVHITDVVQDSFGFIWIGSFDGLIRYDGSNFKSFYSNPNDSTSISDSKVQQLFVDGKARMWVGTQQGICIYDNQKMSFRRIEILGSDSIQLKNVTFINEGINGGIWIGLNGKHLYKFDESLSRFEEIHFTAQKFSFLNNIFYDHRDRIHFATENGIFSSYFSEHQALKGNEIVLDTTLLSGVDITHINKTDTNIFWLFAVDKIYEYNAQDHKTKLLFSGNLNESIYRFFSKKIQGHPVKYFNENDKNTPDYKDVESSLKIVPRITSLNQDDSGLIWVSSYGTGLFKLDPTKNKFKRIITRYMAVPGASKLCTPFEISPGHILFDGVDGLRILNQKTGLDMPFDKKPSFAIEQWNSGHTCFSKDDQGNLWFGTAWGGVFVKDTLDHFRHFKYDPKYPESGLGEWAVRAMLNDSRGNTWISYYAGGVSMYDVKNNTFRKIEHSADSNGCAINWLGRSIYEDLFGKIWLGTRGGIYRYDYETEIIDCFHHDPQNPSSIGESTGFSFAEDLDSNLWVGTFGGGLNKFNRNAKEFTRFTMQHGLPNNVICGIEVDHQGLFWLSTFSGLARFNPITEECRNFTHEDGLLNREYSAFTHYRSPTTGHMYFEGEKGLDYFHPRDISIDSFIPRIVITDFKLSNKSVDIKKVGGKPLNDSLFLDNSIMTTKDIYLNFNQKVITFEFASMDFRAPDKNKYAYQLVGFDHEWQHIGTKKDVTFTNLDPGKYTLKVKGTNKDGVWNEQGTSLNIRINPPWYLTWWAKIIAGLIIIGILLSIYRFQRRKWEMQLKLQQEINESDRLKELDRLKSQLYMNITHEFRTPITVILGMADQIKADPTKWMTNGIGMIKRNGQQLLNLVNQMLDLRKLESSAMNLQIQQSNIVTHIQYIAESFQSFATTKNIIVRYESDEEIMMDYDKDKITDILSNLLSNAIKFSNENSEIIIKTSSFKFKEKTFFKLSVTDQGVGIPKDKIEKVFQRFYQVDDSTMRKGGGTGIGLFLTRELVSYLNGTINVESEPELGSKFIVTLPITNAAKKGIFEKSQIDKSVAFNSSTIDKSQVYPKGYKTDMILVVEDNTDVTQYIISCLEADYRIVTAQNGKVGLEKALDLTPDLILCDVMMPEMDGFELLKSLREDIRTSHIPVILLTAKADIESKLEGLEYGADAYLSKPFDRNELSVRIRKLIELRRKLQERYSIFNQIPEKSDVRFRIEDDFVKRLVQIVEQQIDDENLSVDVLASKVFLSRSQLHRKLKAITGISPGDMIRTIRLTKALELISETGKSITEISFDVGFTDVAHFSRVFSKQYLHPPSYFRK